MKRKSHAGEEFKPAPCGRFGVRARAGEKPTCNACRKKLGLLPLREPKRWRKNGVFK